MRSLITISVASVFVSCAQVLTVQPSGSLRQGIVFAFGDEFREHPPPFEVETVWLHRYEPNGGRTRIWMLEGKQRLQSITYGARYPGLKTVEGPEKLMRGKCYEIVVWTANTARAYYSADFCLDYFGVATPVEMDPFGKQQLQ